MAPELDSGSINYKQLSFSEARKYDAFKLQILGITPKSMLFPNFDL